MMEIRAINPEEFRAYFSVWERTFNFDAKDEEVDLIAKAYEVDRSIVVVDNGQFVGTGGSYSFDMTVPGGSVLAAGLTGVAVLSTHRRQGVLTAMMHHHFEDVKNREEPVALLRASESGIYSRFGYGVATQDSNWKIDRRDAALVSDSPSAGVVSLVDAAEARKLLPEVYTAATPKYPGFLSRSDAVWDLHLADLESWRDGLTTNRFAVYQEDGDPLGYMQYRAKESWENNIPNHELSIGEFVAATPEAERSLLHFLFSTDLVGSIRARNRPTKELLNFLLVDSRRLIRAQNDGVWARLVDVRAALEARQYRMEGRLVIEVVDEFLPEQGGRFVLVGGPDGAECHHTSDEPDLVVDAVSLGACYLGGGSFSLHRDAGRVTGSIQSVQLADTMFSSPIEPWSPHEF